MRHIMYPEPLSQNGLFDSEKFGWWHTQLAPEAFAKLSNGLEGVFRASILKLMPAAEIAEAFDPLIGRPTKELHAICGLLLLGEYRNWTVEETANAWCFDASVQFALNLPRDHQHISERTVESYRQLLRENEVAQGIFEEVTSKIIQELGIVIKKQRLDSTHLLSNMAKFGRVKLLAVTVKRFLTQLKRHDLESYQALAEDMKGRYEASESRLFGMGKKGTRPHEQLLQEVAEDIAALVVRFAENEKINTRPSFQALRRVFCEHCEVSETEKVVVQTKAQDVNGQSARILQNSSDRDAGYHGHKGAGYQVQISQAYDTGEEGPGIITACLPQSAAESDSASLALVQAQQKRMGTLPEIELADSAYGSQANVEMSAKAGVKLLSPAGGSREKEPSPVQKRQSPAAEEKKKALDHRRAQQESAEWKREYAKRSGLEGVHEALDRTTGIKRLKVRGIKGVSMSVFLKVTGWNIASAAKMMIARRKKAKKRAKEQKKAGLAPWMRRIHTHLCPRSPSRLPLPRFERQQHKKIDALHWVGQTGKIVFAGASYQRLCGAKSNGYYRRTLGL